MSKHAYVVKVLRPHPRVYNPDRPISDLVKNQLLHLSLVERHLPKRHRTGRDVYSIQTEREASEYIRHITSKLHPEGAKKQKAGRKTKPPQAKSQAKNKKTIRGKKS